MNETFGYNEEVNHLISNSITEADFILAKKAFDPTKLLMEPGYTNTHDMKSDMDGSQNFGHTKDEMLGNPNDISQDTLKPEDTQR